MEFRILGPLEIGGAEPIELPPGQRSSLLIDLLIHAGEPLSVDRLIDDLWEREPPASAHKIVQLHISHLRRQLGPGRIELEPTGYVLRVRNGELDSVRAEQLAAEAVTAPLTEQIDLLRKALALWRGPALADVAYQSFARNEAMRLQELHLTLRERLFEARLAAGEQRDLVADLEAMVAEQPLREHLRALLMLALYRSGRQAEALEAYRRGRARMREELGLEPSLELQQLERRILEQDGSLELPVEAERSNRSRRTVLGIALALASLAVGLGIWSPWSRTAPPQPRADAAVELADVSGRIDRVVHLGRTPRALANGAGALWSADFAGQTVTRVDLRTGRATVTGVSAAPTTIAFGLNAVWVGSSFTRMLYRLDPRTGELTATLDLPDPADALVTGGGRVWVVDQQAGTLVSVDPTTGNVRRLASHLAGPSGIAADHGFLWIALSFARKLLRIDMRTLARSTYPLQLAPGSLAVGCGAVWLTNPADNEVTQFDLRSHRQQTIAVGDNPVSVTADDRYAWVSNDLGHTTQQIDCIGHVVVQTVTFGATAGNSRGLSPTATVTTPGGTWVALQRF